MSKSGMRKLTAATLSRQIETGRYGEIPKDRLREALTTGPDLTGRERSLLLLSPVARDDWNQTRREIIEELYEQWRERHLDNELVPLAAAENDDAEQIRMLGPGFSVTLIRQDEEHTSWIILVQLTALFRDEIHLMTQLRLVDEGGLEWMRGQTDDQGEMVATWESDAVNLYARARRYCLRLEPM